MILHHECTFSLDKTLASGQTFAWSKIRDGIWAGVVNKVTIVAIDKPDVHEVQLVTSDNEYSEEFWNDYFGFNDNGYEVLSKCNLSDYERQALEACKGITILHQPLTEVLISFMLSQNNSIMNIITARQNICNAYGLAGVMYGVDLGDYPTLEEFCKLTEQDLKACKAGYRAKYLAGLDYGRISKILEECKHLNSSERHTKLCSITGIGDKVASCIELFGYHDLNAVPVDTWIKKIHNEHPETKDYTRYAGYAGLMQEYLYMYRRSGGK